MRTSAAFRNGRGFPPMIDRVGPTRRPALPVRGNQNWRSLLFMHWPVSASKLRAIVPQSLELDLYHGQAYVGVVPFVMEGVRPRWWPARLGLGFLETNVRAYVLYKDQPGVYFISLDAASRLAVWTARRFWGLPYHHAAMSIHVRGDEIDYSSRRTRSGEAHRVRYRLKNLLGPSRLDSPEFFFLERYLLFVEHSGMVYCGQVHHRPYPAQEVEILDLSDELVAAAGLGAISGTPEFAHFAAGVDVEIFGLRSG